MVYESVNWLLYPTNLYPEYASTSSIGIDVAFRNIRPPLMMINSRTIKPMHDQPSVKMMSGLNLQKTCPKTRPLPHQLSKSHYYQFCLHSLAISTKCEGTDEHVCDECHSGDI
eukprot:SAG31_NODE_838_length_11617_cov_36.512936_10_plen_113_part_00